MRGVHDLRGQRLYWYRGGSAGLLPGTVHTEVATPMLPTLCAVARALLSTVARSSPAAADAPATCAKQLYVSGVQRCGFTDEGESICCVSEFHQSPRLM